MGDPLEQAVAALEAAGLVAFPTETVWGLAADATSEPALERLRAWKGREARRPIAILVESIASLAALDFELGPLALRLAGAFWPGPLCLVLRCHRTFASGIARADGAVGVRCSSHPVASALASALAKRGVGPVTATSLNPSGAAPARTREAARACCGDELALPRLLDLGGADAFGGPPSTVVDATGERPVVLRAGAIGCEAIEPEVEELRRG